MLKDLSHYESTEFWYFLKDYFRYLNPDLRFLRELHSMESENAAMLGGQRVVSYQKQAIILKYLFERKRQKELMQPLNTYPVIISVYIEYLQETFPQVKELKGYWYHVLHGLGLDLDDEGVKVYPGTLDPNEIVQKDIGLWMYFYDDKKVLWVTPYGQSCIIAKLPLDTQLVVDEYIANLVTPEYLIEKIKEHFIKNKDLVKHYYDHIDKGVYKFLKDNNFYSKEESRFDGEFFDLMSDGTRRINYRGYDFIIRNLDEFVCDSYEKIGDCT